jgi:hypothetical protein
MHGLGASSRPLMTRVGDCTTNNEKIRYLGAARAFPILRVCCFIPVCFAWAGEDWRDEGGVPSHFSHFASESCVLRWHDLDEALEHTHTHTRFTNDRTRIEASGGVLAHLMDDGSKSVFSPKSLLERERTWVSEWVRNDAD